MLRLKDEIFIFVRRLIILNTYFICFHAVILIYLLRIFVDVRAELSGHRPRRDSPSETDTMRIYKVTLGENCFSARMLLLSRIRRDTRRHWIGLKYFERYKAVYLLLD